MSLGLIIKCEQGLIIVPKIVGEFLYDRFLYPQLNHSSQIANAVLATKKLR